MVVVVVRFVCKKGCKDCFHSKIHGHNYMCDDIVGKCPKCVVTKKKGEGNDKLRIHWTM